MIKKITILISSFLNYNRLESCFVETENNVKIWLNISTLNWMSKFVVLSRFLFVLIIIFYPSIMFCLQSIIEGTIFSKGKAVSNVNVTILNTKLGTTSDEKGFFRITGISPGEVTLKISHINYKTYKKEISLKENETLRLSIELEEKILESEAVTITAYRRNEINISSRIIDSTYIHSIPSLAEPDLFRSLMIVPGIVRSSDFTTQFFVRGGSPDQNLILIDNAQIYNPQHIGGFVSSFDVDIVKNAELKTGGYSSRYGGKLSSVLQINTKEGISEKLKIKGGIGLLSSKLSASKSFSKGSWIASVRRTYIELITRLVPKIPAIPYNFTDVFGKLSYNLSQNHRAVITLYSTRDFTKYEKLLFRFNVAPEDIKFDGLNLEKEFNKWGSHLMNF